MIENCSHKVVNRTRFHLRLETKSDEMHIHWLLLSHYFMSLLHLRWAKAAILAYFF